jgi:hypothetical protein
MPVVVDQKKGAASLAGSVCDQLTVARVVQRLLERIRGLT